jgi:hypothetical protein
MEPLNSPFDFIYYMSSYAICDDKQEALKELNT